MQLGLDSCAGGPSRCIHAVPRKCEPRWRHRDRDRGSVHRFPTFASKIKIQVSSLQLLQNTTVQARNKRDILPLVRQRIAIRPRPASWTMRGAQIDEGVRIGAPQVLQAVIRHERELPHIASVEGDAVNPRTLLRAAANVVVKIQPVCNEKDESSVRRPRIPDQCMRSALMCTSCAQLRTGKNSCLTSPRTPPSGHGAPPTSSRARD